ncbi:MAG: Ldh family oxidoreductase [Bacteroidetes bacterium]|nr:Ldh family oxidoreductase [Bacteroidota bacterium]
MNRVIRAEDLTQFVSHVFISVGFKPDVALIAAKVLVEADLRGIESHGVGRLHGYLRQVREGIIKPDFTPFIERERTTTAILNGDKGLGLYNTGYACNIAIEKAKAHGSGWVAIKNSSHFGIAMAHAKKAIEHNMIAMVMTNASPLVAPAGGNDRMLGTNPICVCIPAGEQEPFILDMATTVVANGKLEVAKRKGEDIPIGYAQTKDGQDTTSANALIDGGTMLPLGSSLAHSSYKGYGLASWVDIFTGVLSGANFGPWVPPFVPFLGHDMERVGEGLGHFIGVWNIDAFMDVPQFKARMDKWILAFKNSQPNKGIERVLIPGEIEANLAAKRQSEGIPVHESVVANLEEIATAQNLTINWK